KEFGPALDFLNIHQPIKESQSYQSPTTGREGERSSSNSLNDGRDAQPIQSVTQHKRNSSCDQEGFDLFTGRTVRHQYFPAHRTPNGVGGSRDTVDSDPSAAVDLTHQDHVHPRAEIFPFDKRSRRII